MPKISNQAASHIAEFWGINQDNQSCTSQTPVTLDLLDKIDVRVGTIELLEDVP